MRIFLTKRERQSLAGLQLLELCQTITEDGRLTEGEIADLRHWIDSNQNCGLAAWGHLKAVLDKIFTDGRVTREETRQIHEEILRVLPTEFRTLPSFRKKEVQREEQQTNAPLSHWDFMVAGVRYERRAKIVYQHAKQGDEAYLLRDRDN
jgi:hypothetical protein